MDVFFPCDTTAHLNTSRCSVASKDLGHRKCNAFSMNNLEVYLTGIFNNGDTALLSDDLSGNENNGLKEDEELQSSDKPTHHHNYNAGKCLSKSPTFPCPRAAPDKEKDSGICELKESVDPFSRSASLPISLKLVSAMKGSREKQGMPRMKQSVTWAPDVYDPIPTSASHVPLSKNQQRDHRCKKSGRHKQKGGNKSCRNGKKNKSKGGGNGSSSIKQ